MCSVTIMIIFFFNDTATTEIYTLSLHDALPISRGDGASRHREQPGPGDTVSRWAGPLSLVLLVGCSDLEESGGGRSEEHTSELQSRQYLVCRLLLEKKKKTTQRPISHTTRCLTH